MSANQANQANQSGHSKARKITGIATTLSLAVFIAIAAITTLSVDSIVSVAEANILANKNGVPEAWSDYKKRETTESETTARVINDEYVQYTTYLKNNNDSETISVTHLASYLSTGENSGFVPLNSESLEYTYDPSNTDSWTPVNIETPSSEEDGFKLDYSLYVGQAESNTDTIYFRYNVDLPDDGLVDDKVTFVTEDASGSANAISSYASVDYVTPEADSEGVESVEWAEDETAKADSDEEYTKPLGVFSETPTSSIINISSLGAIAISQEMITPSVIIICVALGLFALGLIVYLILRRKAARRS